jgi:Na+/serine symporter
MQTIWMIIIPILIFDLIMKGIALWKAGNQKQLGWFIVLFILNTAGILPLIYLIFFQKNKTNRKVRKKK